MKTEKLKSGIIGQAQVIFGGAIAINIGTVKNAGKEVMAVGLAELKHPAEKAGDPINDEETYNGIQVSLVFPNFDALNNFRNMLDQLEVELKERIAKEEASPYVGACEDNFTTKDKKRRSNYVVN